LNQIDEEKEKVKALEDQLVELRSWSESDKQSALDNRTAELQENHQALLDEMKEKHAIELMELTETKDSLDLKLAEKLREIREDMESGQTEALEKATDVAKAMLTDELENLKHTHAAEVRLAVDAAITKLRSDHAEEAATLAAKHREELSKASADMTVLSEAHGAKTSALEIAIEDAKADLRAAEEKTKKMSEIEGLLESKSKELEEATSALAEIQTHLKNLEHEHKEMALSITKSVPPLNDLTDTA
jgi:hypothetical protein